MNFVKLANKISLRMRITLLAGAILVLCSVVLTYAASYNAGLQFTVLTTAAGPVTVTQGAIPQPALVESGTALLPVKTLPGKLTAAKKQFNTASIIIFAVVCILGMGLVYVVAGRSLRPIRQLSRMISLITESELQYRLADEERGDEVGALGRSFNAMLDRLEMSFLRQKRFSANVAHELKTPLATINAGIQVLNLDETPSLAEYKKTLETTERNVKRLMAVVDDLMRLCDEQEVLELEAVPLREMFNSICEELKPLLAEKRLTTELDCQIQSVCANPRLLYRACFNLIENAAKYNKEGGEITIAARAEGGYGEIKISDTGGGIPLDELENIFEPFYRVNKSRSRKTGGAGLGLSIVKTIVEKHGWKIAVESAWGAGSTFTIVFAV